MSAPTLVTLSPEDRAWPAGLAERLGSTAPPAVRVIGPAALLVKRKTALFCSARAPGDSILRAHDAARRLRDEGATVISGFHSPIEKECLRILLRGEQPIIICPARSLEGMRLPSNWKRGIDSGRLLLLSPFLDAVRRVSAVNAERRNEFVAALADEVFIAYIAPGGNLEGLSRRIVDWGLPITQLAPHPFSETADRRRMSVMPGNLPSDG